ncbi:hypothetical protein [Nocardia sp. NPDC058705]|uniref:hypothetical protein n=1 Tax=Nocardia sp. NPDC058705 TaxID=3346609 RepID=UPI00367F9ED6
MVDDQRIPCRWRKEPFEIWVDDPDHPFIHYVGTRDDIRQWRGMSLRHQYGIVPRSQLTYVGVDRALAGALIALDDAFAAVGPPVAVEACPCCRSPADYAVLLSKPRHQLTGIELGGYAFRVLGTVGSEADLRYLAGRILQLVHTGDAWMPEMEVVYGKLRRAGWRSWPQADAIADVLDTLWHSMFTANDAPVGAVVCAVGTAEQTIATRLAQWELLDSPLSIRNLREFVVHGCRLANSRLVPANSQWDRTSVAYGELVGWLSDGPVMDAVTAAFDRTGDLEQLELLAETYGVLEWVRPAS